MADVVTLSGRVHEDPDLKFTNSGGAVANFTIVVTTGPKKDGDKYPPSAFFQVTAWNGKNSKLAENIVESVKKGNRVVVSGKLTQDTWEDADGNKRSAIKVIANEVGIDLAYVTAKIVENERTGRKPSGSSSEPDWS